MACPAAWDLLWTVHALTLGPTRPQPHRGLCRRVGNTCSSVAHAASRLQKGCQASCVFVCIHLSPCSGVLPPTQPQRLQGISEHFWGFTSPLAFADKASEVPAASSLSDMLPTISSHKTIEVLCGELGWSALCSRGGQSQTRRGPEARP